MPPSNQLCPLCGLSLNAEQDGYFCPTEIVDANAGYAGTHYYRMFSTPDHLNIIESMYVMPFVIDNFHWQKTSTVWRYGINRSEFVLETALILPAPENELRERIKLLILLS